MEARNALLRVKELVPGQGDYRGFVNSDGLAGGGGSASEELGGSGWPAPAPGPRVTSSQSTSTEYSMIPSGESTKLIRVAIVAPFSRRNARVPRVRRSVVSRSF